MQKIIGLVVIILIVGGIIGLGIYVLSDISQGAETQIEIKGDRNGNPKRSSENLSGPA